jgi:FtsH-binding integral membrane protein
MSSALALNLGLGFAALSALCLSLDRHHRQAFQSKPGRRRVVLLRVAGWLGLGLSLLLAGRAEGWAFGPVQWLGTLTAAGVALVLLMSYRPRIVYPASALALLAAGAAAFSSLSS